MGQEAKTKYALYPTCLSGEFVGWFSLALITNNLITMKKLFVSCLTIVGLLFSFSGLSADKEAKEITIKGEGKCGKCALKETASCQNVIQVEKGKNKGTYYLAQNQVSKDFHDTVCKESKQVKATGTVKEVDGKKEFTATKIEEVK